MVDAEGEITAAYLVLVAHACILAVIIFVDEGAMGVVAVAAPALIG